MSVTGVAWTDEMIVDYSLNPIGAVYSILFSNQGQPVAPGEVGEKPSGSVEFTEVDGSITSRPVRVVAVNLQPMEKQVLAQSI